MLTRRTFLATSSAAAAAGALALNAKRLSSDWSAVREEFDLDPSLVHLSLFYMTPHPRVVRAAVEGYRRQLDSNPFLTVEHGMFDFEHMERTHPVVVANALGRYIGGDGGDVALTQNTTTGLSLAYHGLPLAPGDEVVVTTHDHYSHHESVRLAAERSRATWRKIALYDPQGPVTTADIVDRVRKGVGSKTRVLGITWVHSSSGVKLPIREIAAAVASINAARSAKERIVLVVDGVHGMGSELPDIVALGADIFVAGTHKWLFAPRGTGFVWARPEMWAKMRPLVPTFTSGELWEGWATEKPPAGTPRANWFSPGGFQAFDHFWAVPAAIEMHRTIGSARITERIHTLNELAKTELAKMKHVTLYTPRDRALSSGIVCFDVQGKPQNEVVRTLQQRDHILASSTPYPVSYARVAFGIYNTEAEVEKTVRAIAAMG